MFYCDIGFAENAFAFQIKQLVEQLMFLEDQIEELDKQISHLLTAVGAVARKMCNIIFTILRGNRSYEVISPKRNIFREMDVER